MHTWVRNTPFAAVSNIAARISVWAENTPNTGVTPPHACRCDPGFVIIIIPFAKMQQKQRERLLAGGFPRVLFPPWGVSPLRCLAGALCGSG